MHAPTGWAGVQASPNNGHSCGSIAPRNTSPHRHPLGSFVGGTLANLMHVEFYGWLGNLVVASVGAIIVLWVWRRFRDRPAAS